MTKQTVKISLAMTAVISIMFATGGIPNSYGDLGNNVITVTDNGNGTYKVELRNIVDGVSYLRIAGGTILDYPCADGFIGGSRLSIDASEFPVAVEVIDCADPPVDGIFYVDINNDVCESEPCSISPEEQIQQIDDEVNSLSDPDLNSGNIHSLSKKLEGAIKNITNEDPTDDAEACEKLQSFIDQLNAFVNAGKLDESQTTPLIEVAEELIGDLCTI